MPRRAAGPRGRGPAGRARRVRRPRWPRSGSSRRSGVYWAGRATLVHRPEDVPAYDRAFAAVFEELGAARPRGRPGAERSRSRSSSMPTSEPPTGPGADEAVEGPVLTLRWSDREVLRAKDFAACTRGRAGRGPPPDGRPPRWSGARRRSRRLRPSRRTRGPPRPPAPPSRRRAAHRWRAAADRPPPCPATRPRRVVLLCDVSGSMEAYARALVRFAHVAVAGRAQVEVFTLGTRCTRITRELAHPRPRRGARRGGRRRRRLVRAARGWARGCARSTTRGGCGAWPGAPSW